jgi:putative two-component system response regulator
MWEAPSQNATILIVDDEPSNVRLLERFLERAGYTSVMSTTDPREVLSLVAQCQPDLILLDLHMPFLDGFAVMQLLGTGGPRGVYRPVLVLTADITLEAKQRALSMGAADFITKPFDPTEVLLRVKNQLKTRVFQLLLEQQAATLEEKVRERTRELEQSRLEMLERLALAVEFRDDDTHQHTVRVGQTAALIAATLELPGAQVELIRHAAPLHDIGKVGIPDAILLKPGKLTVEEFAHIQTHSTIGARILAEGRSPLMVLAAEIAHCHHERWDGSGYPRRLQGAAIPLAARIVAVADVFDALTNARPYKAAWPVERAIAELRDQRGRHFDPWVVEAFLQVLERGQLTGVDIGRAA